VAANDAFRVAIDDFAAVRQGFGEVIELDHTAHRIEKDGADTIHAEWRRDRRFLRAL
jgi:hypothetical protein